jgi:uncharacterized RDD family membrane protein YckC
MTDPAAQPQHTSFPSQTYGRPPDAAEPPVSPQPTYPIHPAQTADPTLSDPAGYAPQSPGAWTGRPSSALQPYSPAYPAPYEQPYQQPYPMPPAQRGTVVSEAGRLGASLLDGVLIFITAGIGWMIWSLISWSTGQSPAKQLLGHVVADAATGRALSWGRMFVREFLIRGVLFLLLNVVTLGIFGLVDACMIFRAGHRTLHDTMAGSIVRYR